MFKLTTILLLAATQPFSEAAVERSLSSFLSKDEINLVLDSTTEGNAGDPFKASRWTAGLTPSSLVDRLAEHSPYNHRRWLRNGGEDGTEVSM
jgi:hypothetical protein